MEVELATGMEVSVSEVICGVSDFSKCMVSLHASYGNEATKWQRDVQYIRRSLTEASGRYVRYIVPKYSAVIADITEYCNIYLDLTFEEWREDKRDLLEEIKEYKSRVDELCSIHEDIYEQFQRRIIDTSQVKTTVHQDHRRMEKDKAKALEVVKEMDAKAAKYRWIPLIGGFFTREYDQKASEASAISEQKQIEIEEDEATIKIMEEIITTLQSVTSGLEGITKFFSAVQFLLQGSEADAQRAPSRIRNRGRTHFNEMKNGKSAAIKKTCMDVHTKIPIIKANFHAITQ